MPSDNDLQRIATQHALGRPLPDYIPDEVQTLTSNWCRSHGVTVTVANAATVYQHLRQYVKDNSDNNLTGLHDSLRYVVVIFVNAALYFCPNEHVIIINDSPARPTALWCGHCYERCLIFLP